MKSDTLRKRAGARRITFLIVGTVVFATALSAQTPTGPARAAQTGEITIPTGPAIGAPIPAFRLPDQNGQLQTFDSVRGPKGLALYFNRSVDW